MIIHPLWCLCLAVRLLLSYSIYHNLYSNYLLPILFIIFIGFMYKSLTGSNNEKQISKVFWHDSRFTHGLLYALAFYYLYNNNYKMSSLFVFLDLLFSISYRILFNK